jgi:hypothetical protein
MDTDKNQEKMNGELNAGLYTEGTKVGKETSVRIENPAPDTKKIIIEKEVNVKTKGTDSSVDSAKVSDLLDAVYRISGMGLESIKAVNNDIDCKELKSELDNEFTAYQGFHDRAKGQMKEKGLKVKEPNPIVKAMRWSAVKMNAMAKKTGSHVAEMMINGTTMGIIEIRRNSNAIGGENPAAPLADEFYNFMRTSIDKLTSFL